MPNTRHMQVNNERVHNSWRGSPLFHILASYHSQLNIELY